MAQTRRFWATKSSPNCTGNSAAETAHGLQPDVDPLVFAASFGREIAKAMS